MMYIVSLFSKFFDANCKHIFIYLRLAFHILTTVLYLRYIWLYSILVKNPSPKPKPCKIFRICDWIENIVLAHNFRKVSLLRAYISMHKFDVICIPETFLNSDTAFDDDNFKIEGYNIAKSVYIIISH